MITQTEGEVLNNLIRLTKQACTHDYELELATHCLEMASLELMLVMSRRFESRRSAEEDYCSLCGQQSISGEVL